jgi:thiamine-phosphate pyrophosphorylase
MQATDFKLYLITDRHQTCGRPLAEVVRKALDGGVKAVQLREKDLSGAELYRLAVEMRGLTAEYDARLIINDRSDIAQAVEADGVQVGIKSLPVAEVRRLLGRDKLIIYSAHAVEEAAQAGMDGADMVTFGPVDHTPSKAGHGAPCGVANLSEAVHSLSIPVRALGAFANSSDVLSSDVGALRHICHLGAARGGRRIPC